MRCALLGPTPGNRPSSSIRSWTTPSYIRRAYWSSSPITVPPRTRAMTGWPTATASSMSSSSVLTMLSSAPDGESLVSRVLSSLATAALARCIGVEGRSGGTAEGAGAGGVAGALGEAARRAAAGVGQQGEREQEELQEHLGKRPDEPRQVRRRQAAGR